jgi:hypothetical protein
LTHFPLRKLLALLVGLSVLAAAVYVALPGSSLPSARGAAPGPLKYSELPNPLERGPYTAHRTDPVLLGTYSYEEPNGNGKAPTGSDVRFEDGNSRGEEESRSGHGEGQIRGVMFTPEGDTKKSPLIVFMAGNAAACDVSLPHEAGVSPQGCEIYARNDEGYAYIGENLASWGYTVYSIDEDELINRQDGSYGKGMHARRTVIKETLDKLKEASETDVPEGPNSNIGDLLDGKVDMSRIGLVGHSRGGDSVSSFLLYNQTRPKGERFPIRAAVSIAPVDYERHAPYGVPYMTIMASCDGDVSNLQGARLYQRSLFQNDDPYPRYQVMDTGGDHNGYNTVWVVGEDDGEPTDAACTPGKSIKAAKAGTGIRLSSEAGPLMGSPGNTLETSEFERVYKEYNGPGATNKATLNLEDKLNPLLNTEISGNPELMGDQEKLALSSIGAFLRRYVGGEGAFEPYLTGELAAEGDPDVPQEACPTSIEGTRIPCLDRVADSYMAPPDEREDVLIPGTEDPTTVDQLGTSIEATGFANPYTVNGGIQPRPATTSNGLAWCDPEPEQTEPGLLKESTEFPTAPQPCPQPAAHTLGGQGSDEMPGAENTAAPREHAYVNASPGRQLAVAWEGPAHMSMAIPAKDGDVAGYRALYLSTAVNFFDPRNPPRGIHGIENPLEAPQNFTIAVTDAEGHEATVEAGNPDFGTALQQTLGNTSDRVHVLLQDLRVPLAEFAAQGVNLSDLRKLELRFGEEGMPTSGSIELSNIRFQQPASGYSDVFLESTEPNAGPGDGVLTSGPNPVKELEKGVYKRADGEYEIPNVTQVPGANVWTVSNNGSCPNAQFEHIQEAVNMASPWDTIVVCPGVYEESSTPINSEANPVSALGENGLTTERDGLTINKPLKIIGAGANKVTIKPAASLKTLGGAIGTLRDGGGNVITVSRQSLGSTEYMENYVDISGVKIESGSDTAEAGVAFFNASGRIADSEIGTIKPVNGNGWGVVATNSMIALPGPNNPERNVTLEDDVIKGYSSGGVMIDDSEGGVDGAPTNSVESNMGELGYIEGTRIEGSGAAGQTGIAFKAGATGKITDTAITKNEIEDEGVVPVTPPSGPIPTAAGVPAMPDAAPVGSIVNPGEGESVEAGVAISPVVAAEDDYGVRSVVLKANGVTVGTKAIAPYVFSWTPTKAQMGTSVQLEAQITDSAGHVTTSDITVPVVKSSAQVGAEAEAKAKAEAAAKETAEKKASEDALKAAESKAEAAQKEAKEAKEEAAAAKLAATPISTGKAVKNTKKGTVRLTVTVPTPGALVVTGPDIVKVTGRATAPGNVQVLIKAKGKALKTLKAKGKVTVSVKVTFTGPGGTKKTTTETVTLVKK